ncbi:glycosyl hydrolase family 28-related protein [Bacillus cereus group sp. IBL03679]|uniref:glycosyl hydrolase family 28-related protein n=1 Tax=Bacillus cereus group sp. IBL03679 TaxID=3240095 RepID=UPI003D2F9013
MAHFLKYLRIYAFIICVLLVLFACFLFLEKDKEESSPNYQFESGLSVKDFGAKGDGKTNDSPAIQEAVRNLEKKGGGTLYFPKGNYLITASINVNKSIQIKGEGKYNSILKLNGPIKAIDLSSKIAKLGVAIESLGIVGTGEKGQIGIDAYYFVNGSRIQDVRIENVDTGIRLVKTWYASLNDIYISRCKNYGLHIISPSGMEQVNGMRFSSIFIQGAKNAVFLDGQVVSMGIHFDSSTFEKSKETAIISKGISPLLFTNCYFEANYQEAKNKDLLTWSSPIDVKIEGTKFQTLVKFDSCYFTSRNDFLKSSEKTRMYIGENTIATITNSRFVTKGKDYLDANIFSGSTFEPSIINNTEDGASKQSVINKIQ